MNNIEIILVSNSGMLLKYNDIKILIDGIYIDKTGYFSQIPEEIINQYKNGTGEFGNVNYILFTHDHQDHFSIKALETYLKYNTPQGVFLPHMSSIDKENLKEKFKDKKITFIESLKNQKHMTYIINKEIKIDVYPTTHCGKEFENVCNLCYLITINDEKILFTGDIDMKESNFWFINELGKINTLVVNAVFIQNTEGRRLISEFINPQKVLVCHIPFEEDDRHSWRKHISSTKKRYKGCLPQLILLMEKKQGVFVEEN